MNNSNFVDSVNERVVKLWEKTFNGDYKTRPSWYDAVYSPLIYPSMNQDVIVFIGLNPSFNTRIYKNVKKDLANYGITDLSKFYLWKNYNSSFSAIAQNIEAKFRDNYSYFKKFKDIADYTSTKYEHIDLFFFQRN